MFTNSDGKYTLDAKGSLTAAVPEPGYLWLPDAALLGLFGWRRSREWRTARRID